MNEINEEARTEAVEALSREIESEVELLTEDYYEGADVAEARTRVKALVQAMRFLEALPVQVGGTSDATDEDGIGCEDCGRDEPGQDLYVVTLCEVCHMKHL